MRTESVLLFFILFTNSIVLITDFRLVKTEKRKEIDENAKKTTLDNIPTRIGEKISVKSTPFQKNFDEYIVVNIEAIKQNETLSEKLQPVSSIKKNLTKFEADFKKNVTKRKESSKPTLKEVLSSIKFEGKFNKTVTKTKIIKDLPRTNITDTKKPTKPKVEEKIKPQNVTRIKKPDVEEVKPSKIETKPPKTDVKPSKIEAKLPKTEVKPSKIEVKLPKSEVKTPKIKVETPKLETKLPKTEVKPLKPEMKTPKIEVKPSKTEVKPSKTEVKPSKTEIKPSKTEVKPSKTEVKPSKTEIKPPKTEAKTSKTEKPPETKTKPSKTETKPPKTEVKPAKSEKPGKVDIAKPVEKVKAKKKVTEVKVVPKKGHTEPKIVFDVSNYYLDFDYAKNEKCRKEGEELEKSLEAGKLWAMKMYDASAKIPSSILKGNLNQFGDYDQCISIYTKIMKDQKKEKDLKITGKYCLASVDIEATAEPTKLPVNLAQGRAFLRSRNKDPGHFIPKFSTIRWGVCVPASCSSGDVQNMLTKHVEHHNESFSNIALNIVVESEQCVTKKHFDVLGIGYETMATILLLTSLMAITFAATIKDCLFSRDENGNNSLIDRIFTSFSLKQTTKSFLNTTGSDEIQCVHGIRALTTILLYIAHKLIPAGHSPYTNRILLTEMSNNPLSIILRVSIIYTDTFLLLSGFLTAYHMSKDLDVRGHIPWVNRIFSRLIRLLPTLVVVLLYYSYLMDQIGNGPLWNTVVKENADLCKETWWKNALFIQNLYPFEEMCATQTHQLALDMQLFLIAPALVWFLQNRTYFGLFVTAVLHIISAGLRYYTTIRYKLSVIIYHGISLNQLYRTANLLYASSIHRATPYLAGICLGVTLRQIRPDFQLPKIFSLIGWGITGYLTYWIFYMPSHLADRMYRYDSDEAAIFAALCSIAWAFTLSWIIFSSHLNYEGYLNKYLSSKPMVLLSKLSYPMYLVQFIVFFYNVGTIRAPSEFNINGFLNIQEFLIVTLASVLLYLIVDLPMQEVKKSLMKPTSQ